MLRCAAAALLLVAAVLLLRPSAPYRRIVRVPAGTVEVHSEMHFPANTEVVGQATLLHAAADFQGRAILVVDGPGVRLRDFTIDGNRDTLEQRTGLPPSDVPFSRFTHANGILADSVRDLRIERVAFRNIAGFAVLVSRSQDIAIDHVRVDDSGSRDGAGRNNTTGGILLEEGSSDFRVTFSEFRNVRGNGVWTHSLYTSPRNARGLIADNLFDTVGRDAIQVGHAVDVRVEENSGARIGFPFEVVDMEHLAVPAALDTAGNVERCAYVRNRFNDLDGKCIDLDGFHDGAVFENTCINTGPPDQYRYGNYGIVMNNSNPDMQPNNVRIVGNTIVEPRYGGIFIIGEGNVVARNRLLNVIPAREGPDILRSGIYLGAGADRPAPARRNRVEDNDITGSQMAVRCVSLAPGVAPGSNTIRGNRCRNE